MASPRRSKADILMLGTSMQTMGGIASVMSVYRDDGLFERWPIEHVVTHRDGSAFVKASAAFSALARVSWRLLFSRPALMHLHVSSRASFWRKSVFMGLAATFRVPYLLHLHGSEFQIFYRDECGPRAQWLVRWFFGHASRVVVLSDHWHRWVVDICPEARVEVVFNPVLLPPDEAAEGPREEGTVLFLGRLGQRKGVYDLIRTAARLAPQRPKLRLLLGGDGEIAQARELAEELRVADRVDFLGWVGPTEKAALLRRAAVYALPSYHEGLPMSVLEAMSYGLAILSTPIGGIPEAIDSGVHGLLVPPGDVEALADALGRLLDDPGLRLQLGRAARERVAREFASTAVVPRIEAIYRAHTHRSGSASPPLQEGTVT